jgi:hypothetical protein
VSFPILRQPPLPRVVDDVVGMATTHRLAYYDCLECDTAFPVIDGIGDPTCPTCGAVPLCPECMENHADSDD